MFPKKKISGWWEREKEERESFSTVKATKGREGVASTNTSKETNSFEEGDTSKEEASVKPGPDDGRRSNRQ